MTLTGILARLQGLWHIVRRHDVNWRAEAEPGFCTGDIVCETCELVIWCRALE